jgi:hypothetical protein
LSDVRIGSTEPNSGRTRLFALLALSFSSSRIALSRKLLDDLRVVQPTAGAVPYSDEQAFPIELDNSAGR